MLDKLNKEFKELKCSLFRQSFSNLNDRQQQAVFQVKGPVVVLAGAGSGKTTAIISKIVNMIRYGDGYMEQNTPENLSKETIEKLKQAYDNNLGAEALRDVIDFKPIRPENILAITFTNKAANELKSRLQTSMGNDCQGIWAMTFHSMCARILRIYADKLGYTNHFTIYDEEDSLKVIKENFKILKFDDKVATPKSIKNMISRRKDRLNDFDTCESDCELEVYSGVASFADMYKLYQKKLKEADAMDFDDLIFNTVLLFEKFPEVLEKYQDKFKYIIVDEYQDTNYAQYLLVKMLSEKNKNLCVVGDDDQSIYKFRGASVRHIIDFEDNFENTTVIKFEQNYRSTKNILKAANSIICHNKDRHSKVLWTENEDGSLIKIHTAYSEHDESNYIAEVIQDAVAKGQKYSDFAVLYRLNSQSNVIEKVLTRRGIPYRVFSGLRFYDRKEIRDVLAYLSVINNPLDEVRLKRIINKPRRSIGDRTITQATEIANETNKDLLSVMRECDKHESLQRVSMKLKAFSDLIDELIAIHKSGEFSLSELYDIVLDRTGYLNHLKSERDKYQSRMENVKELQSSIKFYEEEQGSEATLSGFLEEISLFSDIDNYDVSADAVILMTIHSSKGLEFPNVFIPGLEEGIFPCAKAVNDIEEEEEERRLAYVGMTRCKKNLYLLNSDTRMIFGCTSHNKASVFLSEIPEEIVQKTKSRDWKDLEEGAVIPKSAQEIRAQSVMAAHNFGGIAGGNRAKKSAPVDVFELGDKVRDMLEEALRSAD